MPNDINDLDVNDIGLKGIFGDRWHDETQCKPTAEEKKKEYNVAPKPEKSSQKRISKVEAAEYEPERPDPNVVDRLKSCVKWVLPFGGLNMLIFYWQMAELMAESIAIPCMWICCAMAGYGVGVNVWRGRK